MHPFFDVVIAPVLRATDAKRVVEIGALRGDTTRQLLEALGDGGSLHIIDPKPQFDPATLSPDEAARVHLHADLSVNVLGALDPADVVLIDGDHNYFTVRRELDLIAESAGDDPERLPVLVLHDVGWPYGRRDLYYDPDSIPPQHRHPHRKAGMRQGRSSLVERGGLSSGHWNAEHEGGPANGVMTALEDFIEDRTHPVRTVLLPLYFGLAIVVDERRLAGEPALARVLDRIESAEGRLELIELGEEVRLRAMTHHHTLQAQSRTTRDGLSQRYVDMVIRGLVNEFYLENEVRLDHMIEVVERGGQPNAALMRDPVRAATVSFERLRQKRRIGAPGRHDPEIVGQSLAPAGRVGLDDLVDLLDRVRADGTEGQVVFVGSGQEGLAILARAYLEAYDMRDRSVWVADRFRADGPTDLNQVRDSFERFDLLDEQVKFLQGDPRATLRRADTGPISLLVLGDLDERDATATLKRLYPRVSPGGAVVVTDDEAIGPAVARFRSRKAINEPQTRFATGGSCWVARDRTDVDDLDEDDVEGLANAPLARPRSDLVDLSVVIVFYNMRREASRSLHALSRAYQRGVEDLDYEVIAIDNGSAADQRVDAELVASFGPNFRYIDMGPDAPSSPTHALNRGIAEARGRAVCLMIDGAHVVTPGVLRYGCLGLDAYDPAIVAVQAWYMGPGQQGESMRNGYDQVFEDQLFDQVEWPTDGYRLFEIGHGVGDRDWLDGLWESNCLFVTRKQLEQVGGFDEGFSMPGGGYTNLEIYERLGASPDVEIVTMLGEASFHQVHGGTTTNLPDSQERRTLVDSYAQHYAELRGRRFIGPEKPVRYVGAFETNDAKRTRARRMTAAAFDVNRELEGDDGPLGEPRPVPEDLRDSFIDAYWRSQAWRTTNWFGHQVPNAATDLVTYAEIVDEVRPDWVVVTSVRGDALSTFFATMCDQAGHGQVVAVNKDPEGSATAHPRLHHVSGTPHDPEVVSAVESLVGPDARALVVLGTRGRRDRMKLEFDSYWHLVPEGSYVIVEHTMLNGWPVDGSFGRGPFEAVRQILATRSEFVVDHERERQSLTFNPWGYLRRVQ